MRSSDSKKIPDSAKLESISLKSSNSNIVIPPESINSKTVDLEIDYQFNSTLAEGKDKTKVLLSFVGAEVKGIAKEVFKKENPELKLDVPLFSCSCLFVARYQLSGDFGNEECEMFTRNNALFNIFPYLREYIESTTTRLGVVGVMLPLFKKESSKTSPGDS